MVNNGEESEQIEADIRFLNMDMEMEVLDLESCFHTGESFSWRFPDAWNISHPSNIPGISASPDAPNIPKTSAPRLRLRAELAKARRRKGIPEEFDQQRPTKNGQDLTAFDRLKSKGRQEFTILNRQETPVFDQHKGENGQELTAFDRLKHELTGFDQVQHKQHLTSVEVKSGFDQVLTSFDQHTLTGFDHEPERPFHVAIFPEPFEPFEEEMLLDSRGLRASQHAPYTAADDTEKKNSRPICKKKREASCDKVRKAKQQRTEEPVEVQAPSTAVAQVNGDKVEQDTANPEVTKDTVKNDVNDVQLNGNRDRVTKANGITADQANGDKSNVKQAQATAKCTEEQALVTTEKGKCTDAHGSKQGSTRPKTRSRRGVDGDSDAAVEDNGNSPEAVERQQVKGRSPEAAANKRHSDGSSASKRSSSVSADRNLSVSKRRASKRRTDSASKRRAGRSPSTSRRRVDGSSREMAVESPPTDDVVIPGSRIKRKRGVPREELDNQDVVKEVNQSEVKLIKDVVKEDNVVNHKVEEVLVMRRSSRSTSQLTVTRIKALFCRF